MSYVDTGFVTGHYSGRAAGIAIGREYGYTDGWNEATIHAQQVIDGLDARLKKVEAANARLGAENQLLIKKLREQQQAIQDVSLVREQAESLRADYESMFKAFLGAVAIAGPAMKILAKQSVAERYEYIKGYSKDSLRLQSREYVAEHGFPHASPMIAKYMPVATSVIDAAVMDWKKNNENAPQQGVHS